MKRAVAVTIEGKRYEVAGLTRSGSRGDEYQLRAPGSDLIIRVCHAPPRMVSQAITSGETIHYHWS